MKKPKLYTGVMRTLVGNGESTEESKVSKQNRKREYMEQVPAILAEDGASGEGDENASENLQGSIARMTDAVQTLDEQLGEYNELDEDVQQEVFKLMRKVAKLAATHLDIEQDEPVQNVRRGRDGREYHEAPPVLSDD